jgi:hypothetical protein
MNEHETTEQFDIDNHDEVREVVELAMEGAQQGDLKKLNAAFHEKARMYGSVHGGRYDTPIKVFFALCEKFPLGEEPGSRKKTNYRSRIISITRVGDAAMAMVAEDGCWRSAAFVDFFTVTRNDGKWQITNKTFACTGGEIPDEVMNWAPPPELDDPVEKKSA